jgi:hypothetical protein
VRNLEGDKPLGNLDVDARIILKLFKKYGKFFFFCLALSSHTTLLYHYVIRRVSGGFTVSEGSEKRIGCDNIL